MGTLLKTMHNYALEYKVPVIDRSSADVLAAVVTNSKPKAVLEIGTAIGYSTLIIAGCLPSDSHITTIELDSRRAETARNFIAQSGFKAMINLLEGDAAQLAAELAGPFDFIFIDAAKGQYLNYLMEILDKLTPEAVIVADNVLFRGWVRGAEKPPRRFKTIVERLRQYLAFVTNDCRFSTTVYETGDGIAVSFYRRDSWN